MREGYFGGWNQSLSDGCFWTRVIVIAGAEAVSMILGPHSMALYGMVYMA